MATKARLVGDGQAKLRAVTFPTNHLFFLTLVIAFQILWYRIASLRQPASCPKRLVMRLPEYTPIIAPYAEGVAKVRMNQTLSATFHTPIMDTAGLHVGLGLCNENTKDQGSRYKIYTSLSHCPK